ncbi:MAG TPA: hypothetical protein DCZ23_00465 [Lachnospiraceae bacterium]|nr:hypothetical protein [Lachnospiraceae bacterium]
MLYIFDMDGTILDSMPLWRNLDNNYLSSYNITPPDNLDQIIAPLTLPECADYFISLGINKERDCIISEIISIVEDEYKNNVGFKPGMYELLTELYSQGQTICLLTTSDRSYAVPALKRLKIYDYFDAIYTSTELNLDKRTPEIYKTICRKYNTLPEHTTVYEDTLFAVNSAKGAGCHVVAVYDKDSGQYWNEIKQKADEVFY